MSVVACDKTACVCVHGTGAWMREAGYDYTTDCGGDNIRLVSPTLTLTCHTHGDGGGGGVVAIHTQLQPAAILPSS